MPRAINEPTTQAAQNRSDTSRRIDERTCEYAIIAMGQLYCRPPAQDGGTNKSANDYGNDATLVRGGIGYRETGLTVTGRRRLPEESL